MKPIAKPLTVAEYYNLLAQKIQQSKGRQGTVVSTSGEQG